MDFEIGMVTRILVPDSLGQPLTLEGRALKTSANSNAESKKNLSVSHPKNHDFCCLDEGGRSLTSFETHFPC